MGFAYAWENYKKIRSHRGDKKINYYLSYNGRAVIGPQDIMKTLDYPIPHKTVKYQKSKDTCKKEPINVTVLFAALINAKIFKGKKKGIIKT